MVYIDIGNDFVKSQQTLVLRVLLAIGRQEYNLVINTNYPDYCRIRVIATERFEFDPRIVSHSEK